MPETLSRSFGEGGYTFLKRVVETAIKAGSPVQISTGGMILEYTYTPGKTFLESTKTLSGNDFDSLKTFNEVAASYSVERGVQELLTEQKINNGHLKQALKNNIEPVVGQSGNTKGNVMATIDELLKPLLDAFEKDKGVDATGNSTANTQAAIDALYKNKPVSDVDIKSVFGKLYSSAIKDMDIVFTPLFDLINDHDNLSTQDIAARRAGNVRTAQPATPEPEVKPKPIDYKAPAAEEASSRFYEFDQALRQGIKDGTIKEIYTGIQDSITFSSEAEAAKFASRFGAQGLISKDIVFFEDKGAELGDFMRGKYGKYAPSSGLYPGVNTINPEFRASVETADASAPKAATPATKTSTPEPEAQVKPASSAKTTVEINDGNKNRTIIITHEEAGAASPSEPKAETKPAAGSDKRPALDLGKRIEARLSKAERRLEEHQSSKTPQLEEQIKNYNKAMAQADAATSEARQNAIKEQARNAYPKAAEYLDKEQKFTAARDNAQGLLDKHLGKQQSAAKPQKSAMEKTGRQWGRNVREGFISLFSWGKTEKDATVAPAADEPGKISNAEWLGMKTREFFSWGKTKKDAVVPPAADAPAPVADAPKQISNAEWLGVKTREGIEWIKSFRGGKAEKDAAATTEAQAGGAPESQTPARKVGTGERFMNTLTGTNYRDATATLTATLNNWAETGDGKRSLAFNPADADSQAQAAKIQAALQRVGVKGSEVAFDASGKITGIAIPEDGYAKISGQPATPKTNAPAVNGADAAEASGPSIKDLRKQLNTHESQLKKDPRLAAQVKELEPLIKANSNFVPDHPEQFKEGMDFLAERRRLGGALEAARGANPGLIKGTLGKVDKGFRFVDKKSGAAMNTLALWNDVQHLNRMYASGNYEGIAAVLGDMAVNGVAVSDDYAAGLKSIRTGDWKHIFNAAKDLKVVTPASTEAGKEAAKRTLGSVVSALGPYLTVAGVVTNVAVDTYMQEQHAPTYAAQAELGLSALETPKETRMNTSMGTMGAVMFTGTAVGAMTSVPLVPLAAAVGVGIAGREVADSIIEQQRMAEKYQANMDTKSHLKDRLNVYLGNSAFDGFKDKDGKIDLRNPDAAALFRDTLEAEVKKNHKIITEYKDEDGKPIISPAGAQLRNFGSIVTGADYHADKWNEANMAYANGVSALQEYKELLAEAGEGRVRVKASPRSYVEEQLAATGYFELNEGKLVIDNNQNYKFKMEMLKTDANGLILPAKEQKDVYAAFKKQGMKTDGIEDSLTPHINRFNHQKSAELTAKMHEGNIEFLNALTLLSDSKDKGGHELGTWKLSRNINGDAVYISEKEFGTPKKFEGGKYFTSSDESAAALNALNNDLLNSGNRPGLFGHSRGDAKDQNSPYHLVITLKDLNGKLSDIKNAGLSGDTRTSKELLIDAENKHRQKQYEATKQQEVAAKNAKVEVTEPGKPISTELPTLDLTATKPEAKQPAVSAEALGATITTLTAGAVGLYNRFSAGIKSATNVNINETNIKVETKVEETNTSTTSLVVKVEMPSAPIVSDIRTVEPQQSDAVIVLAPVPVSTTAVTQSVVATPVPEPLDPIPSAPVASEPKKPDYSGVVKDLNGLNGSSVTKFTAKDVIAKSAREEQQDAYFKYPFTAGNFQFSDNATGVNYAVKQAGCCCIDSCGNVIRYQAGGGKTEYPYFETDLPPAAKNGRGFDVLVDQKDVVMFSAAAINGPQAKINFIQSEQGRFGLTVPKGADYDVTYDPTQKLVTLNMKHNGQEKTITITNVADPKTVLIAELDENRNTKGVMSVQTITESKGELAAARTQKEQDAAIKKITGAIQREFYKFDTDQNKQLDQTEFNGVMEAIKNKLKITGVSEGVIGQALSDAGMKIDPALVNHLSIKAPVTSTTLDPTQSSQRKE